jgi:hypothetical protein
VRGGRIYGWSDSNVVVLKSDDKLSIWCSSCNVGTSRAEEGRDKGHNAQQLKTS